VKGSVFFTPWGPSLRWGDDIRLGRHSAGTWWFSFHHRVDSAR